MTSIIVVGLVITVLVIAGRAIWPTHLTMVVPPSPDRSTGRWLKECEQILAAGTGRHRAPTTMWAGWVR